MIDLDKKKKTCGDCGEKIALIALKCRYCSKWQSTLYDDTKLNQAIIDQIIYIARKKENHIINKTKEYYFTRYHSIGFNTGLNPNEGHISKFKYLDIFLAPLAYSFVNKWGNANDIIREHATFEDRKPKDRIDISSLGLFQCYLLIKLGSTKEARNQFESNIKDIKKDFLNLLEEYSTYNEERIKPLFQGIINRDGKHEFDKYRWYQQDEKINSLILSMIDYIYMYINLAKDFENDGFLNYSKALINLSYDLVSDYIETDNSVFDKCIIGDEYTIKYEPTDNEKRDGIDEVEPKVVLWSEITSDSWWSSRTAEERVLDEKFKITYQLNLSIIAILRKLLRSSKDLGNEKVKNMLEFMAQHVKIPKEFNLKINYPSERKLAIAKDLMYFGKDCGVDYIKNAYDLIKNTSIKNIYGINRYIELLDYIYKHHESQYEKYKKPILAKFDRQLMNKSNKKEKFLDAKDPWGTIYFRLMLTKKFKYLLDEEAINHYEKYLNDLWELGGSSFVDNYLSLLIDKDFNDYYSSDFASLDTYDFLSKYEGMYRHTSTSKLMCDTFIGNLDYFMEKYIDSLHLSDEEIRRRLTSKRKLKSGSEKREILGNIIYCLKNYSGSDDRIIQLAKQNKSEINIDFDIHIYEYGEESKIPEDKVKDVLKQMFAEGYKDNNLDKFSKENNLYVNSLCRTTLEIIKEAVDQQDVSLFITASKIYYNSIPDGEYRDWSNEYLLYLMSELCSNKDLKLLNISNRVFQPLEDDKHYYWFGSIDREVANFYLGTHT